MYSLINVSYKLDFLQTTECSLGLNVVVVTDRQELR